MAEGKTLAPIAPCSLCDEDDSAKFCIDCSQDLCLRCAKAHGKIGATSHHKLIPIQQKGKSTKSPSAAQAYCTEHTSKQLSVICEQCLCALCDYCADSEHKNHRLLKTNLNADLLHRICAQKVPEFMQLLQQLEKQKDGSPTKLQLCKTARDMVKTWRGHLWKIIDDDSNELLKQIEKEIKKQESLLADISSNLKTAVKTTDDKMTALSNARKITDTATLLSNIHDSDEIIKKGRSLLCEIESTRNVYSIDDLLPFRNELISLEKNLHTFFTLTPFADTKPDVSSSVSLGRSLLRNYKEMTKLESHHIDSAGTHRFRISKFRQKSSKTVVIYIVSNKNVYVFDIDSKEKKQFTCAKKIRRMITMDPDRHVIVETDTRYVHILDRRFHVVTTLAGKCKSEFLKNPCGMCPVSNDVFILSENGDSSSSSARFHEVSISKANNFSLKQLCEVPFTNYNGLLTLSPDLQYATADSSSNTVHTLDLRTGANTVLGLGKHISGDLYFIFTDEAGQTLVGDTSGKIHLVTSTQYECELPNMQGTGKVGGITVRGDKLVTVVGECINIYK